MAMNKHRNISNHQELRQSIYQLNHVNNIQSQTLQEIDKLVANYIK